MKTKGANIDKRLTARADTHSRKSESKETVRLQETVAEGAFRSNRRNTPLVRPRLFKGADASERKLILVRAPAGFGKTTFLEQFLEFRTQKGCICAWLTLDSRHNDQNVLIEDMLAAIQRALPLPPSSLASAGDSQIARLLEHLSSTNGEFMLFLDEIDAIQSDDSRMVLGLFIKNTPPAIRVVAAGRSIPFIGQSKLRLTDNVVELNDDDLRFRLDEISAFISERLSVAVTSTQINNLHDKTDGWAAALQLACLSINSNDPSNRSLEQFSGVFESIFEYLQEDVFDRLPQETKAFLIDCSVLKKLTGDLCGAVSGQGNCDSMLAQLESDGLFLKRIPTNDERTWYSLHAIFSDFLKRQLRLEGRSRMSHLCERAAKWYESVKRLADAAEYSKLGGHEEIAYAYLERIAMSYVWQGQFRTVMGWCENLTVESAERYEQLFCAYLWAEVHIGDPERAKRRRDDLAKLAEQKTAITPFLADTLTCLPILIAASLKDLKFLHETGPATLANLSKAGTFEYGTTANCLAYTYLSSGEMNLARETHALAKSACKTEERSWNSVYWAMNDGHLQLNELHLVKAIENLSLGYDRASVTYSELSQSCAIAASFLADALYEAGDIENAQRLISQHLFMIGESIHDCITTGYVTAARLAVHSQKFDRAIEILLDAETIGTRRDLPSVLLGVRWHRAWIHSITGDLKEACRILEELTPIEMLEDRNLMTHADSCIRDIVRIRILISVKRFNRLEQEVDSLIARATARKEGRRMLRLKLLKARLTLASGKLPEAKKQMSQILPLGLNNGFMQCFFDEGLDVVELVRQVAGSVQLHDVMRIRLMERLRLTTPPSNRALPAGHASPRLAPHIQDRLTQRETDLLLILEKGLTNREIADCFGLSENTVKWHLQHIFEKLGVANRTEASFLIRQ